MQVGFRFRILFGILTVAFLFTSGLLFYNGHNSRKLAEQNYISAVSEKLELQAQRFDAIMQEAYELAVHTGAGSALCVQAGKYLESGRTYADALPAAHLLQSLLPESGLLDEIYLFLPDAGQIISSEEHYTVFPVSHGTAVPQPVQGRPFAPMFSRNMVGRVSKRLFAYSMSVQDPEGAVLGTLYVTADERQLYYALLATLVNAGQEDYLILDQDGVICCAQDTGRLGSMLQGLPALENRVDTGCIEKDRLYISVQAPFSGCRLLCTADRTRITQDIRRLQMMQFVASIFVYCALFLAAWLVSRWLYRPVEQLIQAIDQVSGGDFTARVSMAQTDEFHSLLAHFNDMVERIDGLMHQIVRSEVEKKQAELLALQHQIRPHFMYHTLNSIRFAAIMQKNKTLAAQLGSFIALLEASIQKKGAFIRLGEELSLVENYVSLQKFCHGDCFTLEIRAAEAARQCFVPCLLLQPAVENAIFHGIDTNSGDSRIVLDASVQGDRMHLSLQDNGQGMSRQTLHALLTEESEEDRRRLTGIGLRNIKDRLRLHYGTDAQFHITSTPGEGTCVMFDLPAVTGPEEYGMGEE